MPQKLNAGKQSFTCPGLNEWLLAYWMGRPPGQRSVFSVTEMCYTVDRFWVYVDGRWFGYSPIAPSLANDPFDPPLGAAVFLHGWRG